MPVTRRRLLGWTVAAPAVLAPSCFWTRRVRVRCSDFATDPGGPLTIDTHAHFFNASDLAVKGFVQRVKLRSRSSPAASIAEILQNLTWAAAPDGADEQRLLAKLSRELAACSREAIPDLVAAAREDRYRAAAAEIRSAARTRAGPDAVATREADELPATYAGFLRKLDQADERDPRERVVTVRSALLFVVEMLQYRCTSFFDYLETSARKGGPRVDLALSALVDYDWWLQPGEDTRTPLKRQVEVFRDLSVLTGGRVHAWAPFCPLREVIHRESPTRTFSSFELVRWAVKEQGAIGVKLYPPMGFAAACNAGKDVWAQADWLPAVTRRADFGARLDRVLYDLFAWCAENEVPVLAHSNRSNGPLPGFEELGGAPGWSCALDDHPGLRVLFGHFGGASDPASAAQAVALRDLMHPSGKGSFAFADASYFEQALEKPEALVNTLAPLFAQAPDGRRLLAERICFGSDWKMLTLERRSSEYLARLQSVARALASALGMVTPDPFEKALFGGNATTLLGLGAEGATRKRLDRFYEDHRVPRPLWASKVDAPAST